MARRKHRRRYSKDAVCGCPKGTKKVSTCTVKNGVKVCRGRGFGCIGEGVTKKGTPTPRWFPMECVEPKVKRLPKQADPVVLLPSPSKKRRKAS